MDVEQTVRENIDKTFHMSLGTSKDGQPWVVEVHFAYDDKLNLYFRSLTSRRHSQEIAGNPKVAGNIIDKYALGDEVVGVYFEGTAKLLTKDDEITKGFSYLQPRIHLGDDMLENARQEDGHRLYKITVKNWYVFGFFGQPSGKKYLLEWNGGAR